MADRPRKSPATKKPPVFTSAVESAPAESSRDEPATVTSAAPVTSVTSVSHPGCPRAQGAYCVPCSLADGSITDRNLTRRCTCGGGPAWQGRNPGDPVTRDNGPCWRCRTASLKKANRATGPTWSADLSSETTTALPFHELRDRW